MIIKWIKWKIYIRLKRKWNRLFTIGSELNISLWILSLLFSLTKFFALLFSFTFIAEYLLSINEMPLGIESDMLNFIWSIFFLTLMVSAFSNGLDSLHWTMASSDMDWLLSNTRISKKKLLLMSFLEVNIWNMKQVLLNHIPIAIGISIASNLNSFFIVIILLIVLTIYLIVSLITTTLFTNLKVIQLKQQSLITRLVPALTLRAFVIFISYALGKETGLVLQGVSLNNFKNNPEVLFEIIQKIQSSLLNEFQSFINQILLWDHWAFNALSNIILIQDLSQSILSLVINGTCLLLIIILSERMKKRAEKLQINPLHSNIFERIFVRIFSLLKLTGYTYRVKIFFRSSFVLNRLPSLFGGLIFWVFVGLISSNIILLEPNSKIYFLVFSLYLFFPVYFLVNTSFTHLSGMYSIESDQDVTIMHLMANKTLWDIFKRNFILNLITMVPVLILGDIIFYFLSNIDFSIFSLLLLIHVICFIFFTAFQYIPSVMAPHFNFERIEDIDQFSDKEWINNISSVVLNGVIIPCFLVPTALFVAESIFIKEFIFYQFIVVNLLVIIINVSMVYLFRTKLSKIRSIENYH
ncbi:hypothetical protein U9J35_22510 [Rossellomorea aquimaris]|nr:hypothetical protein [Rossellomorea aquimaris]WRP06590.1 hypothetical protein U9J35_22510 [Rossellomorea aquimaris]